MTSTQQEQPHAMPMRIRMALSIGSTNVAYSSTTRAVAYLPICRAGKGGNEMQGAGQCGGGRAVCRSVSHVTMASS